MEKAVMLLMTKRYDTLDQEREHFADVVDRMTEDGFDVELCWAAGQNEDFIIEKLQGATVAFCSGNPPITRRVLSSVPTLKLVQRNGIGVNSIDLDAATEKGIIVNCVTGYCVEELAVHAVAFILANMRSLLSFDKKIRAGQWPKGKAPMPLRMSNITAGVFGLGGSGYHTAKILKNGFGCKIIAYDPFVKPEVVEELEAEMVSFDEFIRRADVISIHAPLTKETRHIFNASVFDKMKRNAIIASTARGGIIDEEALANALKTGKIMAAGIDVFESEPLDQDSPLRDLDNIIMTPHSAYMGKEACITQNYMSSVLPGKAIFENTLYRKYIANPTVLNRVTGYTVFDDFK